MQIEVAVTEIPRILMAFYGSNRVPYFRSAPGIGKTDLVHQGAREITAGLRQMQAEYPDMAVEVLHLASISEVDIRGYLIPTADGNARFTRPPFAEAIDKSPRGILFLDEFPQATHEVQKAVAPLLLDRKIGHYELPPGWMVVAAGNREQDNAGANSMLAHVINRMSLIDVKAADPDSWIEWGAANGIPPEILALAKINPKQIFGEPDLSVNDKPFATPRAYQGLGDVARRWTGGLTAMVDDPGAGMAVIQGFIGEGAAAELAGVIKMAMKLPSYDDIVANPGKVKLPEKPDETYASIMMTVMRAQQKHLPQVIEYLTRFNPNFAMVGICAMISREPSTTTVKGVTEWIMANQGMVSKLARHVRMRGSK